MSNRWKTRRVPFKRVPVMLYAGIVARLRVTFCEESHCLGGSDLVRSDVLRARRFRSKNNVDVPIDRRSKCVSLNQKMPGLSWVPFVRGRQEATYGGVGRSFGRFVIWMKPGLPRLHHKVGVRSPPQRCRTRCSFQRTDFSAAMTLGPVVLITSESLDPAHDCRRRSQATLSQSIYWRR